VVGIQLPTVAKLQGKSFLLPHNTCACHVLAFMRRELVLVNALNCAPQLPTTTGPCQELSTQGLYGYHVGTGPCSNRIESSLAPRPADVKNALCSEALIPHRFALS
jgi:hypothetical protein